MSLSQPVPSFHEDPSVARPGDDVTKSSHVAGYHAIPTSSSSSAGYAPGLAPAPTGLAATVTTGPAASVQPPLIPSAVPITINVDRGTINVRDDGFGKHGAGVGPVSGPAADGPSQEVHPDEDIWEGGLVNVYDYDGRVHTRPRTKRPFGERVCGFRDFGKAALWRAAVVEFFGTMLWVLYLCAGSIFAWRSNYTDLGVFWYAAGIFLLYPLLIFSTTVASGGHLNPIITLATVIAGFTKVSRGLLYLIAQFGGGIVGAALIWGWLQESEQDLFGAGNCSHGLFMSRSMSLLAETTANFFWLFVVFGVALDPAQRIIFGRVLGPIFLSLALAVIVFFTGLSGRYGGAWVHPGRCFGAAVISGSWGEEVWISIIAWLISSILMGLIYLLVPFNHELRTKYYNYRYGNNHNYNLNRKNVAYAEAPRYAEGAAPRY